MAARLCFLLTLILAPTFAQAYIGPGVGVGAITAALGVVGSIFLALFAVIYYPVKRMLKKGKRNPTRRRPMRSNNAFVSGACFRDSSGL